MRQVGSVHATARSPRSYKVLLVCLAAAALLTAMDLGSKVWALDALSAESFVPAGEVCVADEDGYIRNQRRRRAPVVLIDGVLEFSYAENCGAAFGFLRDFALRRYIFFPAALFAVLLLPWMLLRGQGGRLFVWSVPFIVAGALGNLHDRVVHGFVVDFIRFYVRDGWWFLQPGWEYPTFNVADIHITVGVVLILLDGFAEGRRERAQQLAAEAASASPAEAADAAPEAPESADQDAQDEGELVI
ncbi:MAG: signal peptidase II [Sandaracinaceae bacterium]|nr:signal peptidase II [Sandaracinaceae bacterium]